jgi:uncharacterized protein YndB with AHSA1/START domain
MTLIRTLLVAGVAGAWATFSVPAPAQDASPVTDSSYVMPDGERVLELGVVVPAPLDAVWHAMTTSDGFASWAAPVARVDARVGGIIESSYDPKATPGSSATIRNEIVALVPRRLLVIRNVQAPANTRFDVPTFQRLQTALWLESLDAGRTRVTLANAGYRDGSAYDGVYRHFRDGNRWSLEKLRERFVSGPVDWTKALAPAKAAAESAPK